MSNATHTNARKLNDSLDIPTRTNLAIDDIDAAMDAVLTKALASNAVSVSVSELQGCGVLKITGTLTADGVATVATGCPEKKFEIEVACTGNHNLTVLVSGETGLVFPPSTQGSTFQVRHNGTDIVPVSGNVASVSPVQVFTSSDDIAATTRIAEADASGGAITLTLPAAATFPPPPAFMLVMKMDSSSNHVTYQAQSGETIDGEDSWDLVNPYGGNTLVSDGTQWLRMATPGG